MHARIEYHIRLDNAPLEFALQRIADERKDLAPDAPLGAFVLAHLDRHQAALEADAAALPGCVFHGTIEGHGSLGFKPAHVATSNNEGAPAEPGVTAGRNRYDVTFNMPEPVEVAANDGTEGAAVDVG